MPAFDHSKTVYSTLNCPTVRGCALTNCKQYFAPQSKVTVVILTLLFTLLLLLTLLKLKTFGWLTCHTLIYTCMYSYTLTLNVNIMALIRTLIITTAGSRPWCLGPKWHHVQVPSEHTGLWPRPLTIIPHSTEAHGHMRIQNTQRSQSHAMHKISLIVCRPIFRSWW